MYDVGFGNRFWLDHLAKVLQFHCFVNGYGLMEAIAAVIICLPSSDSFSLSSLSIVLNNI
jgi:hypothetical protein